MARFEGFVGRHRAGTSLTAIVLVTLLMMAFSTGSVVLKPKEMGLTIFSFFQNGFTQIGGFFSRTVTSINELQKLRVKYDELENQISQFETIERDVSELRQENTILKQQLSFTQTIPYTSIPAQVIGHDPSNIFSTIVIDKGSRQGIHKDMPVVAFQDGFQGLVGKVLVVSPNTSIVLPVLDPNCFVAARLQNMRYEGLVSGSGNTTGDLAMSYVPKRARDDIQYGDLVITSGMNSIYPEGIYVGRVRIISAKEWETSLELSIEPIIDFSRLEYLFVVQKPAGAPIVSAPDAPAPADAVKD